ncbi:MAG: TonB-dependent receptor [Fidelibacterota bacterium]|nr:MAG: TonB-dependent receptor [Candidatus Neomarinimicrobiota bacterium]
MILPVTLPAQKLVRGNVLQRDDRSPIMGANVMIVGTDEGAATDSEGYFEFSTAQSYPFTLKISHIAFQTLEITVGEDTLLEILMVSAMLPGKDIEVIGERTRVGAEVSSAVEILTVKKIEDIGARDVGDVLRTLPSVVVDASTTGKQTVSIRGSNPNEVAVYLDGLRLNDTNTGLADLSAIDLNELERVEVVKGGATALFGHGAFGGVVNLTSHLPDSNQIAFTRGYGLTDDADQDLSISATGRLGMFAAGGRYSGKSRRYDGRSFYTSIFNSLSAAATPRFGELAARRYYLNNYIELPSIGVAQSDTTILTSATYRGSILTSPDWNLFVGKRQWGWTDHFFTNLKRLLDENTLSGRISKQIINERTSSTLQVSYEQRNFSGENVRQVRYSTDTIHELAELERTCLGYTAVVRLLTPELADLDARIRLEMSLRGDEIVTDHQQEDWIADSIGTARNVSLWVDSRSRQKALARRMGVRIEGSTPLVHYSFYMNQGRNQRLPTLQDLFLWKNSFDPELRELPLEREFVSTTDLGLNLIYHPPVYTQPDYEVNITAGIFVNNYTDKIAYRYYEDYAPSPLNTGTAKISGYEISVEGSIWDRRLRGQWAYQHINLDDPLVFPNKPESRLTYIIEFDLPWLVIGYDYYRDGPQFILYNGFIAAQQLESRESANLNVRLRWQIWRFHMSLAYTVRNIFSDEPVLVDQMASTAGLPFQYYESHRKIITFKVSL